MSRIELLCGENIGFPSITELLEVSKGKNGRLLDGMGPVAYYMQPAGFDKTRETMAKLRSEDWFGRSYQSGFIHRSWMKRGVPDREFDGRPVIGICNTWSELTPCNAHFREIAESVRIGVYEAGGFPRDFAGRANYAPYDYALSQLG